MGSSCPPSVPRPDTRRNCTLTRRSRSSGNQLRDSERARQTELMGKRVDISIIELDREYGIFWGENGARCRVHFDQEELKTLRENLRRGGDGIHMNVDEDEIEIRVI